MFYLNLVKTLKVYRLFVQVECIFAALIIIIEKMPQMWGRHEENGYCLDGGLRIVDMCHFKWHKI